MEKKHTADLNSTNKIAYAKIMSNPDPRHDSYHEDGDEDGELLGGGVCISKSKSRRTSFYARFPGLKGSDDQKHILLNYKALESSPAASIRSRFSNSLRVDYDDEKYTTNVNSSSSSSTPPTALEAVETAVRRAFSMRASVPWVSGGCCRIDHHDSDDHDVDLIVSESGDVENIGKTNKEKGNILKACKRLFGFQSLI